MGFSRLFLLCSSVHVVIVMRFADTVFGPCSVGSAVVTTNTLNIRKVLVQLLLVTHVATSTEPQTKGVKSMHKAHLPLQVHSGRRYL